MRKIAIFVAVVFGVIAMPVGVTMPLHEYRLWVLQKRFYASIAATNPTDSRLISKMAHVGNFGNSNHCDYIAGQFRASKLSREEIQKAYAGVSTPSFSSDTNAPLPVEIYFTDEDIFELSPWSDWYDEHLPAVRAAKKESVYLVFGLSQMHPYFGDIRCY